MGELGDEAHLRKHKEWRLDTNSANTEANLCSEGNRDWEDVLNLIMHD